MPEGQVDFKKRRLKTSSTAGISAGRNRGAQKGNRDARPITRRIPDFVAVGKCVYRRGADCNRLADGRSYQRAHGESGADGRRHVELCDAQAHSGDCDRGAIP